MTINKFKLAQQVLADHFIDNDSITTLELKSKLISECPDILWTQDWVSFFMRGENLSYQDNGTYRTYYRNGLPNLKPVSKQPVTVEDINEHFVHGETLTFQEIQEVLTNDLGVDTTFLGEPLSKSRFVPTYKHHPQTGSMFYVYVDKGHYWSKSKERIFKISDMDKSYIANVLNKHYANVTIQFILNNPQHDVVDLLEQLFNDSNNSN